MKVSWHSPILPPNAKNIIDLREQPRFYSTKGTRIRSKSAELRGVVPEGTPPAQIRRHDARHVLLEEPVDLVLTSPPYPSTYDYLPIGTFASHLAPERDEMDNSEVGLGGGGVKVKKPP